MDNCSITVLGDAKARYRQRCGRALVLTITHIELSTVQRAGDECTPQPAFRQAGVAMRAVVFQCMQLAGNAAHDDAIAADIGKDAHLALPQTTHVTELDWCSRHCASVEGVLPNR